MKALKPLTLLSLFALSLLTSPAFAVDGIADDDHAALADYYENEAKAVESRLQENKALLEQYEMHPYYYGRQGQDFQSHTTANIHEYEELVTKNLHNAELHKNLLSTQDSSGSKTKSKLENDALAIR